jgi:putative ABC transport system permease protein
MILSALKLAFTSMRANKVRTGLTVLGMVVGIASVIIVYSAGEGIRGLILSQIEAYGTNIIETEVKVPSNKKGAAADTQTGSAIAQGVQITSMTLEDMDDVSKLRNIKNAYAMLQDQEEFSYGNEFKKYLIFGVSSEFINIDKAEIETGRFFDDAEDKALAQVAVIGPKVKERLFGNSDPIGKSMKARGKKLTVIGVLKGRGASFGFNFDEIVYIPIRTVQKKIMGVSHIYMMIHELKDTSLANDTAELASQIIRENHDITDPEKDDFRVMTMADMMKTLDTITGAITLLLLAIVAISLVVGGVGILNVMYVVVTERTAEIGLRKAVGARYSDIMWQFIVESILVTIAGGVVGIAIGVLLSFLISLGATSFGLTWRFLIPAKAYIVALTFSFVAGTLFGVFPARKAALLDPVEAIRKE